MKPTTRRSILSRGAFTALGAAYMWAGTPTPATAGGFSTSRFGGERGHAATDDVVSIFYNPAGMALGEGTRIYVEGTFAYRTVDYDRAEGAIDNPGTGTPDDATAANSGPAHLANVLASPFAGVVSDLGKKGFALGLALYVPYGGQAEWDKNPDFEGNTQYPGAVDGPARWATIEGSQRSIYITLGGAWSSPNKTVALGVGINLISSEVSLVRARNPTGTDDLVTSDGTVTEGRSLLEVSDLTVGLGLGAMFQPTDKLRLGVSYQSKPGFGEMGLEGTLTNKFGSSPETVVDVELFQRMPDIVRVGLQYQASKKLVIRAGADYTRWSSYGNQCLVSDDGIEPGPSCLFRADGSLDLEAGASDVVVNLPRDWKDTYGAKLGAGFQASDKFEISGSLAYDSNAVPDETMDPALFDMNKAIVQLGAMIDVSSKFSVHATLGQVIYFSRTTEPRAVDPTPPSLNPDMAGSYSSAVTYGLVGVGLKL